MLPDSAGSAGQPRISVVTPTLERPGEVRGLIETLAAQQRRPFELVLVDAASEGMDETQRVVEEAAPHAPFPITYIRRGGGTAVQRNVGIEAARGEYIAFIDDDVILAPDFFVRALDAFSGEEADGIGAVAGYVINQYIDAEQSRRWRWYRRLNLFTTYEPGAYDYASGYPINRYLQPPHLGVRDVDITGANCAIWRREVFQQGLRFSAFFVDFGVAEDAHLAMMARRQGWRIVEVGRARCEHLASPRTREDRRRIAWKTAVNYRYLFLSVCPERSAQQECRFWAVQFVDLVREIASAVRSSDREQWGAVGGKIAGIVHAATLRADAVPLHAVPR